MFKLKNNQLGPWCSFCEPKTTRATHRQDGWQGKFACGDHTKSLLAYEQQEAKRDERITEADQQTWMRL